jgi:RHS repeat-associated protein
VTLRKVLLSSSRAMSLDYMHARHYGAGWGRFLTVDPVLNTESALRNPNEWNRYAYVGNNPLSHVDPDGRCDTCLDQELGDEQLAVAAGKMSIAEYNARNSARGAGAGIGAAVVASAVFARPALVRTSMFLMRHPGLTVAALRVIGAVGGVDSVEVPGPVNAAQGKAEFLLGEVASAKSRSRGATFSGLLGFTKETLVPALKNHLLGNLRKASVDLSQSTIRISVTAPMTGPSGVTTTVTTVWQVTGGKIALVTGW